MVFHGPMFVLAHIALGNTGVPFPPQSQHAFLSLRPLGRIESPGYVKMNEGQVLCAFPFMNVESELHCTNAAQALGLSYGGALFWPWEFSRCFVEISDAGGRRRHGQVFFNLSFYLSFRAFRPESTVYTYAGICSREPPKTREHELCAGVEYNDCEHDSTCRQMDGTICTEKDAATMSCRCLGRRYVGDACHGHWFNACTFVHGEVVLCIKEGNGELCDAESVEADKCTCQHTFFAVRRWHTHTCVNRTKEPPDFSGKWVFYEQCTHTHTLQTKSD